MKLVIMLVFLLVFSSFAAALVEISEIMYDPEGSEEGHEWVEIYGKSVNLSGWKFYENDASHGLTLINGSWIVDGYVIIVDKWDVFLTDYPNYNGTLIDSSWGSLSQSGESLALKNNFEDIVGWINYSSEWGANDNGKTLCLFNSAWQECLPTPGQENSLNQEEQSPAPVLTLEKEIILTPCISEIIYLGNKYTKLFKINIENKESCSNKDNITVFYNVTKSNSLVKEDEFTKEIGCTSSASTGEFNPEEAGNYTLCGKIIDSTVNETEFSDNFVCANFAVVDTSTIACDIGLEIITNNNSSNNFIYEEEQSIKFKPVLNNKSFPFVIEYWIEDLFGNIVKNKVNTTNTNQKSWKTKLDEKDKVLFVRSVVYPACDDFNATNNFAEEMFIVMEKEVLGVSSNDGSENSSIEIKKVTPEEISYGELIKTEVEIYKGSTNKYSVSVWVEKDGKSISEKTKINLKNKQINYKLTLPVQLKPNCDGKIKDGEAQLIVEGLDERAEKEITISGINQDLCKESVGGTETQSSQLSYKIIDLPQNVVPGGILPLKVELTNDDDKHEFEIWSYLYRGSKCYSCASGERENNLIEFDLEENENKAVEFLLKIDDDLKEGEYKIKVKIRKDNQKTTKDLTETMFVKVKEESTTDLVELSSETTELDLEPETELEKANNGRKGIVVYESSSEKAKNLIPSVLFVTFGLLSLVLVFKKA